MQRFDSFGIMPARSSSKQRCSPCYAKMFFGADGAVPARLVLREILILPEMYSIQASLINHDDIIASRYQISDTWRYRKSIRIQCRCFRGQNNSKFDWNRINAIIKLWDI